MATGVAPRPTREQPQYRVRFGLAYLALALVALAALGAAWQLAEEPGRTAAGAAWAPWTPEGAELGAYPQQIAEHVAAGYEAPGGGLLTRILAGPPVIQDVPLRAIELDPGAGEGRPVPVELTVMYTLCGSGENCTVSGGDASEERHLLVRRQVLELALYTFHHIEPVEAVVALLPPTGPEDQSGAVLLRRDELAPALERPLADTLAPEVPSAAGLVRSAEGRAVDELTRRWTFSWDVQQLQDGSVTMRLAPLERGTSPRL